MHRVVRGLCIAALTVATIGAVGVSTAAAAGTTVLDATHGEPYAALQIRTWLG
jgi:hypothetical protein